MELERKIERLQNDIKEHELELKTHGLELKSHQVELESLRVILGPVAIREYVDHGILGRRVGSTWSNKDLFLEPVHKATPH